MMEKKEPQTRNECVQRLREIAEKLGGDWAQALQTEEGRRLKRRYFVLPPSPNDKPLNPSAADILKAAPRTGPELTAVAERIAAEQGCSVEAAYGRISKERPELAEKYRGELTG